MNVQLAMLTFRRDLGVWELKATDSAGRACALQIETSRLPSNHRTWTDRHHDTIAVTLRSWGLVTQGDAWTAGNEPIAIPVVVHGG